MWFGCRCPGHESYEKDEEDVSDEECDEEGVCPFLLRHHFPDDECGYENDEECQDMGAEM